MMKVPFVSFIGSGNLAWHLAPVLDNTDFGVREVYSQTKKHATELVNRLYQAEVKKDLDFSDSPSRIFVVAVADDVIGEVAREIILPDGAILIHTSGSQPLEILNFAATPRTGVFYPLQTFTKGKKVDFKEIPVLIESEDPETEQLLITMGKAISKKVLTITSAERQALHIAAVFASNFTNHMLTIAKEISEANDIDFELLKPLIAETINKSLALGPENAQTGPAKRGDLEILDKHVAFLHEDEQLAELYQAISQHIIDRYDPDA